MKKLTAELLVVALVIFSGTPVHNRPIVFAAVASPGQVPTPVPATPQLTTPPPGPGVPRPVGQAQPGQQQQQEQLRIVADPATNSLIIYGTVQEYQNVKNILKELDAVPRQVLIEAMILQVDLKDTEDFGVDYEIFRKREQTIFGQKFNSSSAIRTLGTLFPSSAVFGKAAGLSAIAGDNTISAMIRAAATDSRIKIISSPSVIASDNKPARIQVGSEEPVPTGTLSTPSTGGGFGFNTSTSVQYRNTGRILTIIPQVNSTGLVNLQIKAEVSARGDDVTVGQDKFPAFNTQDAETTAVVQDGETLVIGGLIGERKSKGRSGIPYLMDIPVLGRFFGTTNDATDRTELIMLITPRVIRNRDESRQVTADFKSGLEKVRAELERLAHDRAKLLPPRPLPPLPDPNQYYYYDQQQPAPTTPPPGPRASLPPVAGNIMMFSNDPLTGRMMPPMAVPQESVPIAIAQLPYVAPQPAAASLPLPQANPHPIQIAAPPVPVLPAPVLPAPHPYILSFTPVVAPVALPKVPVAPVTPVQNQKPTDGKRIWTVQVAAVAERTAAESLAEKLRRLGYDAYVRFTKGENKSWHRVRVGQLESQKDAAQLRNILSTKKEHRDAYIAVY